MLEREECLTILNFLLSRHLIIILSYGGNPVYLCRADYFCIDGIVEFCFSPQAALSFTLFGRFSGIAKR